MVLLAMHFTHLDLGAKLLSDLRTRQSVAQVQVHQGEVNRHIEEGMGGLQIRDDPNSLVTKIGKDALELHRNEHFIFDDENPG